MTNSAEPDAFHRALAALGAPTRAVELAETMVAALRAGHDMQPTDYLYEWQCTGCPSYVQCGITLGTVWGPGVSGRSCTSRLTEREGASRG